MQNYFYILIVLITFSCSRNNNFSEDIIPKDTMALVLADLHIADATLSVISNEKNFKTPNNYYFSLLKKYNISKARLDSSISYYSKNGDEFDKIYEEIMFIISKKEATTKTEKDDKLDLKKYNLAISTKLSFDDKNLNTLTDNKSSIKSRTGKFSTLFDEKIQNSKKYEYTIKESISEVNVVLKSSVSFEQNSTKTYPSIVIEIYNNNKIESQKAISFSDYIIEKQEWNYINLTNTIDLPYNIEQGRIVVFIANPFKNAFFIDDFDLQIFVR